MKKGKFGIRRILSFLLAAVMLFSIAAMDGVRIWAKATEGEGSSAPVPPPAASGSDGSDESDAFEPGWSDDTHDENYHYTDEQVTINVYLLGSGTVPEDAELVVDRIDGGDVYDGLLDQALEIADLPEGMTLRLMPYDIYFMADGVRLDLDPGEVRIEMTFGMPADGNGTDATEAENGIGPALAIHVGADGSMEQYPTYIDVEKNIHTFEAAFSGINGLAWIILPSDEPVVDEPEVDEPEVDEPDVDEPEVDEPEVDEPDAGEPAADGSVLGDLAMGGASMEGPSADEPSVIAENTIYALLYNDGNLVFQSDDTPEEGGSLRNCWTVNLDGYSSERYAPWCSYYYRSSIKEVTFKDAVRPVSMAYWFYNCSNLTAVDIGKLDTSALTNMSYAFYYCNGLTSLDVSKWDLSSVTNMSYAFYNCYRLTSLNVSGWDLSSVTNMSYAFYNCYRLTSLNVSGWDLGSVTDMSYAFYSCSGLTSLNVSGWDLSSVTNMSYAFRDCDGLTSFDASGWKLNSVEDMSYMFYDCDKLTSVNASGWKLDKVEDMSEMFYGCDKLTSVNASGWGLSSVTNMSNAFRECSKLTSLDTSGWVLGSVTNMSYAFYKCSGLTSLDVSEWDLSSVTNMSNAFYNCYRLTSLTVGGWDLRSVTDMSNAFNNCYGLTSLDVSKWDLSSVTNMSYAFYNCYKLTKLDVGGWNMKKVTDLSYLFAKCTGLTVLDIEGWDVSTVTNLAGFFQELKVLPNLDLSRWNTANVTNMSYMFDGVQLTEFDASDWHWDVSHVTDMSYMFQNCTKLASVDLSAWDTSSVTNMSRMFYNCDALTEVNFKGYKLSSVTSMSYMFYDCDALTKVNFEGYKLSSVQDMSYMFSGSNALQEVIFKGCKLSSVTSMNRMFSSCTALNYVDFSGCELSSVTDMQYMFYSCAALVNADFGGCTLSSVTQMYYMFDGCSRVEEVILSGLASVTDMRYMFRNCTSLNSVNFADSTLSTVTDMTETFYKCYKLTDLNMSAWKLTNLKTMVRTFSGCIALKEMDLGKLGLKSVTNMELAFAAGPRKITLGEHVGFVGTNAFDPSLWKRVDEEEGTIISSDELYSRTEGTYEWEGMNYGGTVFALLYEDGDLVFMRSVQPDPEKALVDVYVVNTSQNSSFVTNKAKVHKVVFKDEILPTSMYDWFYGMNNLTDFENMKNLDTSHVTNMNGTFNSCSYLTELDLSGWDLSKVENLYGTFSKCKKLTRIDGIEKLPSVTNLNSTFYDCVALTWLDVSGWDTSKLTSMSNTFYNCNNLGSLDVSNWNMSSMETLNSTFYSCTSLISLDVSKWDLHNLTSLSNTFFECSSLTGLDVENWNLSSVTTLSGAFNKCSKLTDLDVSKWEMPNVKSLSQTFKDCNSLTGLDASEWDLSSVTDMGSAFSGCTELVVLDTANWKLSNVTNMSSAFSSCNKLEKLDVSGWEMPKVTSLNQTFKDCNSLTELDVSKWQITNTLTNLGSAFEGCRSLTELDLSSWDMSRVTSMNSAFNGCFRLKTLKGSWELSSVTDLSRAFQNCSSLTELDTSGWKLPSLYYVSYAFSGCSSLRNLDVSGWGLSKVSSLEYMFNNCSKLEELDVSKWDVSKVTSLKYMFGGCSKLEELDLNSWNVSNVSNMDDAFYGCKALKKLEVSNWKITSKLKNLSYTFYNCDSLVTLDISNWDTTGVTSYSNSDGGTTRILKMVFGPKSKTEIFTLGGNSAKWIEEDDEDANRLSVNDLHERFKEIKDGNSGKTGWTATFLRVYPITFDGNGGYAKPSTVPEWWLGQQINKDEIPDAERVGADFLGWYTERIGGEKFNDPYEPTQFTYYAHWQDHKYTLILDANNGTFETKSVELEYNEPYTLSSTMFAYDAWHVLTGWSLTPDGEGTTFGANEQILQLSPDEGATVRLYAQWSSLDDIMTVEFDSDGGTQVPSRQILRGEKIGKLPTPVRSGYTFIAWHIDDIYGEVATDETVVRESMTLVAEWEKDLTVTFVYNEVGGDPVSLNRVVHYGKALGELPGDIYFGRKGALIGWFDEEGVKYTADTEIITDVTLYAHWGWAPKFNANGGKFTKIKDYPALENPEYVIKEFPEVEYDGYEIDYWALRDGVTKVHKGDTINLQTQGTEIIAVWKRSDTVRITLNANGGTVKGGKSVVYEVFKGQPIGELPFPTYYNYEFAGWEDLSGKNKGPFNSSTVFDEDTTLVAQWISKECYVYFNRNASGASFSGPSSQTKTVRVKKGGKITTIPGCYREGYILEGWYTDPECTKGKLDKDTEITGNVTYYAKWVQFWDKFNYKGIDYRFGVEWINKSNDNVDNYNDNLEFHPTGNGSQTAELYVYFEVERQDSAVKDYFPKGSVFIKIPRYVFYDKNGDPVDTSNNIETELKPYPKIHNNKNFSYIKMDDCYYLVNNQDISAAGLSASIKYTLSDPSKLQGGATDSNGYYVDSYKFYRKDDIKVELYIDKEVEDPKTQRPHEETMVKDRTLSLEMHTRVTPTPTKSYSNYTYEWNTAWGERPKDADEYFYITWQLNPRFSSPTNQKYTYTWSEENTVHDGTVVYMSNPDGNSASTSCTVVTKHPVSLLDEMPAIGRTFRNEAILTVKWDSGYVSNARVNASKTLYSDEFTEGEFEKERSANSQTVNGGQETILDDKKEISMPWSIYYNGGSGVVPEWDEETQTYHSKERVISFTDGRRDRDLMYSSGRATQPYIWEPNTSNTKLNDDDYYFTRLSFNLREYDAKNQGGEWSEHMLVEDETRFQPIAVYVRYKYNEDFHFYESVDYSTTKSINLPADVVGFEIRYPSTFFWTYLSVTADMRLVPTRRVMALVQSDVDARTTSIFKNNCICQVWHTGEEGKPFFKVENNSTGPNSSALDDLYELNVSKTTQYTTKSAGKLSDNGDSTQDIPMLISGYNNNTSSYKTKRIKSGIFYDLLPIGTTVDPSTVICIAGSANANSYNYYVERNSKLDRALYDVRFEENWQGSGRTMMIVEVAVPDSRVTSQISVLYLLHNTLENIYLNGLDVLNEVAFVNTTEGRVWPDSLDKDITIIPEEDQRYYEQIQEENEGFISYATATAQYKTPDITTWAFQKKVLTNDTYRKSDATTPGSTYTYLLSYGQSMENFSKDIVIYDILEKGVLEGDEIKLSEWHGTFQSVTWELATNNPDMERPVAKIYYSTVDQKQFKLGEVTDPSKDPLWGNLSENPNWKLYEPGLTEAELSKVTAIAVEFLDKEGNPYVMTGAGSLDVYITMKAPNDESVKENLGEMARNEGVVYSSNGDRTNVFREVSPLYDGAEVTLKEVVPDLEKTSDPEAGTMDNPTVVKQNQRVNYTLNITNSDDELTSYDIVVVDEIPAGLYIVKSGITVSVGGEEVPVSTSPRVKLVQDGQKLTFTINSLLPREEMHLVIPVIVTATNAVFDNTAKITEANGRARDITSKTTYHKVVPSTKPVLQIEKTLKGRYKQIEEGEFKFTAKLVGIKDKDGKAVEIGTKPEICESSTTGASGWVSFALREFGYEDLGRSYIYEIKEVIPEGDDADGRIEYATTPVYAKVEIKNKGPYGDETNVKLYTEVTYYKDKELTEKIAGIPEIVNKFKINGQANLTIKKAVAGDIYKTNYAGEFSFKLVQVDNKTLKPIDDTVMNATNGAEGYVTFDPLEYDTDDIGKTFTYEITEIAGSIPGMTYSTQRLYAQVTVSNTTDEELNAPVRYFTVNPVSGHRDDITDEIATITNTYDQPEGSLTVSKVVTGTSVSKDREFHFTLKVTMWGAPWSGQEVSYTGDGGKKGTLTFNDDGIADFTLKHGESITIDGLPAEGTYTVTEVEANNGFKTSVTRTLADGNKTTEENVSGASGTIPSGRKDEIKFENAMYYEITLPRTGGNGTGMFYLLGMLLVVSGLGITAMKYSIDRKNGRRRRYTGKH